MPRTVARPALPIPRFALRAALAGLALAALEACVQPAPAPEPAPAVVTAPPAPSAELARNSQQQVPAWTRGATCYEIFVRSFQDSNGDGIGDFNGLTSRLDYLNDGDPATTRDLGVRCIWLMPMMESPSYHGYDQTDYYKVEQDYGTNEDFQRFIAESHKRGIRVLVDLVLNHSSNQHPWFQAALRDTASPYRSWYRFSKTKPDVKGPWGQEVWVKSPVRDEYYYAVFGGTQPDLNFENPAVREEMKKVARYWLTDMGADGFRLDAIRYVMEDGGMLAESPGTHEVLRDFAAYRRSVKADAWDIGEVYAPSEIMLTYFPDQLDAYFAFDVADGVIAAVRAGSAKSVLAAPLQLQRVLPPGRYAPFLRNHDQPRTRTELGGDLAKSRIASFVLLTLPGVPFVYYGEEIGMIGNKPDERIRTPMQWAAAPAGGFSTGRAWEALQPDSMTTTVAAADADPRSILNLHRRLIHLRAANSALAMGELVPLTASHDAVAAYLRRDGDKVVLAVANLGTAPLSGVSLSSAAGTLAAGTWSARTLFGDATAPALTVSPGGRIDGWVPLPTLAPTEGYLFELTATR